MKGGFGALLTQTLDCKTNKGNEPVSFFLKPQWKLYCYMYFINSSQSE